MGRPKVAAFRALAENRGWLDSGTDLLDAADLIAAIGTARRARSTISSIDPHRTLAERWHGEGISGVVRS